MLQRLVFGPFQSLRRVLVVESLFTSLWVGGSRGRWSRWGCRDAFLFVVALIVLIMCESNASSFGGLAGKDCGVSLSSSSSAFETSHIASLMMRTFCSGWMDLGLRFFLCEGVRGVIGAMEEPSFWT